MHIDIFLFHHHLLRGNHIVKLFFVTQNMFNYGKYYVCSWKKYIVWCWVECSINVRSSWLIVFFNTCNNILESQVLYAKLKKLLDSKSFFIGLSLHLYQKSIERICVGLFLVTVLFIDLLTILLPFLCYLDYCNWVLKSGSVNSLTCSFQNCFDYYSFLPFHIIL